MIGYRLGNTLSDSGTVARGICKIDDNSNLIQIDERTAIERKEGEPSYLDENDKWVALTDSTPVSMNMWGFTPDYFELSKIEFVKFLKKNKENLKAEFLISTTIDKLIKENAVTVSLLDTPSKWFGVTYAKDKPDVVKQIQKLIAEEIYPEKLF